MEFIWCLKVGFGAPIVRTCWEEDSSLSWRVAILDCGGVLYIFEGSSSLNSMYLPQSVFYLSLTGFGGSDLPIRGGLVTCCDCCTGE